MDDGLLSLKWNNHKTTFFDILRVLRDKASYTDATLAVDGKFYPVHKLVLSTCSEYFNEIFERTPCKSPVVVLKDVRHQDLESLLDYMYLGEVNVNQNDLAILLRTAECLRIKGLAVPDDEPVPRPSSAKLNCNIDDSLSKETPPAKRRKEESSSSIPLSPHKTASTTTASHISNSKKEEAADNVSSHQSPLNSPLEPSMVKVEMKEHDIADDDGFQGSNFEDSTDNKDYIGEKNEDPYSGSNFSRPPQHHAGEVSWDEGDSSYPSDGFGGDQSSQQGGGDETVRPEPLGLVQVAISPPEDSCSEAEETMDEDPHRLIIEEVRSLRPPSFSLEEIAQCAAISYIPISASATGNSPANAGGGGGDYRCNFCGKLFFYPSSLEKHVRTHTGEKPFKCSFCPYCASQKSHLKTHLQRRHNKTYEEVVLQTEDHVMDVSDSNKQNEVLNSSILEGLSFAGGNY